jgi:hypothetical protein
MKSYLLSSLVHRFSTSDLASFAKVNADAWLLWEPGSWKPARRTTLVMEPIDPGTKPKGTEALALVLEPPKNHPQVRLGRAEDCELCLNDATLSQQHILLMRDEQGHWTVRDAQSRNGTWLDGVKMAAGKPAALHSGAQIRAGEVLLTFYSPAGLFSRIRGPQGA